MFKLILSVLFCLVMLGAHAETFVAGKDYMVFPEVSPKVSDKTQVVEFFNYECPACANLEPMLEQWITQHPSVSFTRIPVVFHPEWVVYAKAYYAADAFELLPKVNPVMFNAIHKEKMALHTNEEMIQFFINKFGVNTALAQSTFLHSTAIDMQIKDGMTQANQYHVTYIPAFVVNNHYKTDLFMAKDPKRLIEILNYLMTLGR